MLACVILTTTAAGAQASAGEASCSGFGEGQASRFDVDQFYAKRAIGIVQAGWRGDTTALEALVAPQAEFEVWRGDYTTSARRRGVAGLVEMVHDVKPMRFQASAAYEAPVAVSKCAWSVKVLFRTASPTTGVSIEFEFADAKLVQAKGNEVTLTEGNMR